MPLTSSVHTAGALTLVVMIIGCGDSGPDLAPVTGKVLLDGQPLTSGRISTVPSVGRGANGAIQSDGTFELTTEKPGDGAVIGTHAVIIASYAPGAGGPEGGRGKLLVPQMYTDELTSGLTIDVKADEENTPVLELSSK